jgi:isobutyryl-CoA mutase
MVNTIVAECDTQAIAVTDVDDALGGSARALARTVTSIELGILAEPLQRELDSAAERRVIPVLGITGTGGSGKSSLTDELILRLRLDQDDKARVAVLAVDPSRRRSGGALLGDRIRMNSIDTPRVFFRSIATRPALTEVPEYLPQIIAACRASAFDLVIVETPGIGQGDSAIVDVASVALYVMTPEYGAASQLEKIDMLEFADVVAINKFERRGAEDALREVRRQFVRNREAFGTAPEQTPVFGTVASRFNDDGVTALYQELRGLLRGCGMVLGKDSLPLVDTKVSMGHSEFVPGQRTRYLAEIAEAVRAYHRCTAHQAEAVRCVDRLEAVRVQLNASGKPAGDVEALLAEATRSLLPEIVELLETFDRDLALKQSGDRPARESLSGTRVPRIALPRTTDRGELVRFLRSENLPGRFPFSGGVFPSSAMTKNHPNVRGGGRAGKDQSPVPLPRRWSAGHPPVDRVRLGHPLWRRPRRTPRHLREGRQQRRFDRHA